MQSRLFTRLLCWLLSLLLTLSLPVQAVESITYLHNDAAGSPVAATDAAGNVICRESYRAYGERTRNETASRANRQFFHGKAFDADTGLAYFGARYYDPVVGRFMAMDPQGFDEANLHSFNRYAYGNNNPYRYTDPSGKVVVPIIIAVGLWLGTEVFGSNPVGPAHGPDAINPTSFPDGSAALKGVGVTLGVIGSVERQGASAAAISTIQANRAAGDAFERQVMGQVQQTQSGVVQQVTVKTQSGVKTRIDLMGRDASGNIVCIECKASASAPLTRNQAAAFPEIQQSGAVVVGKGKPGFSGGTQVPPTKVDIFRP